MDQGASAALFPLRPLTAGELLDAAVVLLRRYARPLLVAGFALALVEQLVRFPLGLFQEQASGWDLFGLWWVWVTVGFGLEAAFISLLAAPASQAAAGALVGRDLSWAQLVDGLRTRLAPVFLVVVIAGVGAALGWFLGVIGWFAAYGLLGMAVPALMIERIGPGPALLRSLKLVGYSQLRALGARLLGYLAWFVVRIAVITSLGALLGAFGVPDSPLLAVAVAAVPSLLINTVAYPVLGCLDAMIYLETRMRVEGLDIAVSRALHRGERPVVAGDAR